MDTEKSNCNLLLIGQPSTLLVDFRSAHPHFEQSRIPSWLHPSS